MIIYGAIAIPMVLTVAAVVLWKREFAWWEPAVPVAVGLLLVIASKAIVEKAACTDTEYWGGWVTTASYFEDWDEEVPCRHPIYRTETDSKGNSRQVLVGYSHAYDVDYHSPYWEMYDSNGEWTGLSESEYAEIKSKCGTEKFVDLHRDYHLNDGDQYRTDAPQGVVIPVVKQHRYENRVQASSSIYKTRELTDEELKKVYGYPAYTRSYFAPSLVGWAEGADQLADMNARLGAPKQVRAMVLVYKDRGQDAARLQRDHWVNGNKNEFVTCVGVDAEGAVTWSECFCWENEGLKVSARNFLAGKIGERLSVADYVAWLEPEIAAQWSRKHFRDFNYLTVEPPWWATLIVYLIVIAVSVGTLAVLVSNEARPSEADEKKEKDKWALKRKRLSGFARDCSTRLRAAWTGVMSTLRKRRPF